MEIKLVEARQRVTKARAAAVRIQKQAQWDIGEAARVKGLACGREKLNADAPQRLVDAVGKAAEAKTKLMIFQLAKKKSDEEKEHDEKVKAKYQKAKDAKNRKIQKAVDARDAQERKDKEVRAKMEVKQKDKEKKA